MTRFSLSRFTLSKFLLALIALCLLPCLFAGRAGAQTKYTDLGIWDDSTNVWIFSPLQPFVAGDVGKTIQITGGPGFNRLFYVIKDVVVNYAGGGNQPGGRQSMARLSSDGTNLFMVGSPVVTGGTGIMYNTWPAAKKQVVLYGNSFVAFGNITTGLKMCLGPSYNIISAGVGGSTTETKLANYNTAMPPLLGTLPTVVVNIELINSLYHGVVDGSNNLTPAAIQLPVNTMAAIVGLENADNPHIIGTIVTTGTPRGETDLPLNYEAARAAVNTAIRLSATPQNRIVDWASDPAIGPTGANFSNPTYYENISTPTHPAVPNPTNVQSWEMPIAKQVISLFSPVLTRQIGRKSGARLGSRTAQ